MAVASKLSQAEPSREAGAASTRITRILKSR